MTDPASEQTAGRSRPRRALILKPCCLGDVLLTTPLASVVAAAWPDATLDWAVDSHSKPALRGNPHVSSLIDASHCVGGDYRAEGLLRLIWSIRQGAYEIGFIPERSPVAAAVAFLGGIPVRVGLDSGGRGRLHTIRVRVEGIRHEADLYLDLARVLGLAAEDMRPVYHVAETDRQVAERMLDGGPPRGPRVAIHAGGGVNPGMRLTEKRWPERRFGALIRRMSEELEARTVLLGGPGDRAAADCILRAAGAAAGEVEADLVGRLSLGQSAAVIEMCDLYIGGDTGATHLATAVGTPVVAIFGPTDPRRYGPAPGTGTVVSPPSGAVDALRDARGSRAIEQVTVEAVWSAVLSTLQHTTRE